MRLFNRQVTFKIYWKMQVKFKGRVKLKGGLNRREYGIYDCCYVNILFFVKKWAKCSFTQKSEFTI